MFRNVLIHYFSGTGNTAHAAQLIEKKLCEQKLNVTQFNIEKEFAFSLEDYDLHIILFPIYGFGIPKIMYKHLKRFNDVLDINAVIIGIGGHTGKVDGDEGNALSHAYKILSHRGFNVYLTDLISYPENFTQIFNTPTKEDIKHIFQEADKKLHQIIVKILNKDISLKKRYILVNAFYKFIFYLYSLFGRRTLGKIYIADQNCNGCKKCQTLCPVENIRFKHKRPRWGVHCEGCQRCINICPKHAIQTSTIKLIVFLLISILPIYLVLLINKMISLHFILDLTTYFLLYVILFIFCDQMFYVLEQHKLIRKFLQLNFTKKYRRYIAKD